MDGSHSIRAKATDVAGNIGGISAALLVKIDTKAPGVPSTPDLLAASDSGVSNTDNTSSVTTPTFTGTAEANATITLFDGATVVGSGQANAAGGWSVATNTLADGLHAISANATDLAGNVSLASAALPVFIDTVAPVAPSSPDLVAASDSGASNTDNITRVTTPTFTGTGEANTTITVFDGATVVGSGQADANGAWSITSRVWGMEPTRLRRIPRIDPVTSARPPRHCPSGSIPRPQSPPARLTSWQHPTAVRRIPTT